MLQYSLKNILNNKICRANRISGLCYATKGTKQQVLDLLAGNMAELNGWKVHESASRLDVKSIELDELACSKQAKPISMAKYKFEHCGLGIVEANSYSEASIKTNLSLASLVSLAKGKKESIKGWRLAA